MYSIDDIAWIPLLIDRAGRGELEASLYEVPDSSMAWGMQFSVRCHEELAFESAEEALAAAADLPAEFRDLFAGSYDFSVCKSWQAGTADPVEDEPVVSDIPTLVFSGYYDPITPPAYGRLAASTLRNSYFFEFPTLSHGVMRSNECARQMGLQFLDDPTSAPDASCMEELEAIEFE
jgi:pimeloyl-ACP methyl ester carboxylesterase